MAGSTLKEEFAHSLQTSLEELEGIWNYIGYEPDERSQRSRSMLERVQKTMLDVIQEENRFRIELETKIDTKKREIAEGCQALGLQAYFPPRGLTSFRLLNALDTKSSELETIKSARRSRFIDLQSQIIDFCAKLDIPDPNSILGPIVARATAQQKGESDEDFVPILTEAELNKLGEKVSELSQIYAELNERYLQLRETIRRVAEEVDYRLGEVNPEISKPSNGELGKDTPDPSPEVTVSELALEQSLLTSSPPPTVSSGGVSTGPHLTPSTLERLTQVQKRLVKRKAELMGRCEELKGQLAGMWKRLGIPEDERQSFLDKHVGFKLAQLQALEMEVERCEKLKWQRIDVYLSHLRDEANTLYAQCFMDTRVDLDSDTSASAVSQLEREIDRLHQVYADNETLFTTVQSYKTLWNQYVETEEKMKDPAILANRGGILLKTDKERKRLAKELPKVEAQVSTAVLQYETQTGTSFRLSGGKTFKEYTAFLWSDFNKSKEGAKFKRASSAVRPETPASPARTPRS